MEIKSGSMFPLGEPPHGGDDKGPSDLGVLLCLVGVALALIGGYFLVMKLIDMSRLEDCMLSGSKKCVPIESPQGATDLDGKSTETETLGLRGNTT